MHWRRVQGRDRRVLLLIRRHRLRRRERPHELRLHLETFEPNQLPARLLSIPARQHLLNQYNNRINGATTQAIVDRIAGLADLEIAAQVRRNMSRGPMYTSEQ